MLGIECKCKETRFKSPLSYEAQWVALDKSLSGANVPHIELL